MVVEAHQRYAGEGSGALSAVYPALCEADPRHFGLAVVTTAGDVVGVGDAEAPFPIMSVAKPFVFALVSAACGLEAVRDRVGVNATGMAFNSASAVERDPRGRTNPMVNAGAIATTSMAPGSGVDGRWPMADGCTRGCPGSPVTTWR
jgi:glutaminase